MRQDLPSGTVTLLFTDIEGSTRLLAELGDGYADLLTAHRELLRSAAASHGGVEVDTQGDALFFAFPAAAEALAAAQAGQHDLSPLGVRVRMGIHSGEPLLTDAGYVGLDVHQAARICAAGHGGQVLVSETAARLAGEAGLRDLGSVRLKDLSAPQRLYQLGDQVFPALRALPETNLPVVTTSLVGRVRELAELAQLIPQRRLVTLTGAGGIGKTRLALQAAADVSAAFRDGVWWVPLTAVRDPAMVSGSIASAVGSGTDLAAFLQQRSALIVLDNVEHLLDAAPQIAALLAGAPSLCLLVTSRSPLHLGGEQRYPVAPLCDSDASALFAERAAAIDPGMTSAEGIGRICTTLDNLPLAIELAAARISVLTPDALLARLEERLPLLTGGASDLPERQRTLRATIDWSHQLLTEQERVVFRRLSVFTGGFLIEASERVCDADLETITSLVDKSLVRRSSDGRLGMLEVVREYAREQLAGVGEHDRFADRHMRHYTAIAEAGAVPYRDSDPVAAQPLMTELGNLRAAVERATGHDGELVLRLGAALAGFWMNNELYGDAAAWLAAAPLDDEALSPSVRLQGLQAAATVAFFVTDETGRSGDLAIRGLALARALGDRRHEARLLAAAAGARKTEGDVEEGVVLLQEALEIAQELDDAPLVRLCLHRLGESLRDRGDYAAARELLERSLAMSSALDDGFGHNTVHSLADLALDAAHLPEALRLYASSMGPANRRGETYCVAGIAAALTGLGDHTTALYLWACAEQQERAMGFRLLALERPRYERCLARAADALGPAESARIRRSAQGAGWDETLAFALAAAETR